MISNLNFLKTMFRFCTGPAILALVVGCAGMSTGHNEFINELVIRNETNQALEDVTLRVPTKNIIVSTNLILPQRDYSMGFQALENERNPAILSWIVNGIQHEQDIKSKISKDIDISKSAMVVISIHADGSIQSSIVPH